MHVSVLGPLQVRDDEGEPVAVSGARLRVLLTRLALDAGRPVPAELLVRAVWDEEEPAGAANALQSLVSRLRRMLGPEAITSGPAGYVLAVAPDAIDAHRFERAAAAGRRLLADGDPAAAEHRLTEALDLWRGTALADAAESGFAAGPAARLEEQRLGAIEDRVEARMRLGRAAEVVPELEQLSTEHPLRERLHGQLVTALDAVGRRADALAGYQSLRTQLADELGIDPSPELEAIHLAVLRGERSPLLGTAVPARAATADPATGAGGSAAGESPARHAAESAGAGETVADAAGPAPVPGAGGGARADIAGGHAPGSMTPLGAAASPAVTSGALPGANPAVAPAAPADPAPPATTPAAAAADRAGPSAPPPATNLTARLTSFVGRDDERTGLARMLTRSRLVSVVGPGGAGKTRITLETGTRLLPEFPGGVWFVELAPVHDPTDIPQAVLSALGRREIGIITSMVETPGGGAVDHDALARVIEVLERRPALLILDNCEHLVADAARVADQLLAGAPALRILTSTREPLGIGGEALYPLGPLELPDAHADTETALRSAAVRLFADRARAVRPGLVIDDANIGAVVEICRRLDGMPLAIELAAARTRALTPTQIARRLDDRFRLLTGGSRTAMPRHQTLRAVVEWSWDLLDERERAVLRRLSVFAGGATLDAAETVLPDGDLVHPDDVLDLLTGLLDKSLVEVFGTGEPRYRMLETIAAFAAENRDDTGADAGLADRHVAWCIDLLERTDPLLRTADQLAALATIAEEHDNFATALRFAVDRGDSGSAIHVTALMSWYWTIRGFHREAGMWLGEALAVPRGDRPGDPDLRALAQWYYGMTLIQTGRESEGLRSMMRSRWHVRHLRTEPSRTLMLLIGALTEAVRDYTQGTMRALGLIENHPDPWMRAVVDLVGGHIAINSGQTDEGLRRLQGARVRFLEIGDRWGRSSAVAGLSEVYRYAGRFDEGIAALDECLDLVRSLGSEEDVPLLLGRRGMLLLQLGDVEAARADLDRAIEVAGNGETIGGETIAFTWAGDLARLLGDREEAGRQYERAVEALPTSRKAPLQLLAYLQLSLMFFAELPGERGKARLAMDAARTAAVHSRDMPVIAGIGEGLAYWALAGEGEPERAATLLGAAVAVRGHADLGSPDALRVTEQVRAALSAEDYDKAFARGRALTHPEAIELFQAS